MQWTGHKVHSANDMNLTQVVHILHSETAIYSPLLNMLNGKVPLQTNTAKV
jgi:hypothetical protein